MKLTFLWQFIHVLNLMVYKSGKNYLVWYCENFPNGMVCVIYNMETNSFSNQIIFYNQFIFTVNLNTDPKGNYVISYINSNKVTIKHLDSNLNYIPELDNSYCFESDMKYSLNYLILNQNQTEVILIGFNGLFLYNVKKSECTDLCFIRGKEQNSVIIKFPEEMQF